ncbi:hypothetical protein ACOAOT_23710 [Lacrimispora sp. AGF001]|uniref:hypothetical protein n=1 Tax=Lacrimispora sp. AGF001 TaxID=3401631 RepID=UPI003B428599
MERQKLTYKPRITIKDLVELRRTLKVGKKIVMPNYGEVIVVKKYPYLVTVRHSRVTRMPLETMTYTQILFQKHGMKWDSGTDGKE